MGVRILEVVVQRALVTPLGHNAHIRRLRARANVQDDIRVAESGENRNLSMLKHTHDVADQISVKQFKSPPLHGKARWCNTQTLGTL